MLFDQEFLTCSRGRYAGERYNPTLYSILLNEVTDMLHSVGTMRGLSKCSCLELLPSAESLNVEFPKLLDLLGERRRKDAPEDVFGGALEMSIDRALVGDGGVIDDCKFVRRYAPLESLLDIDKGVGEELGRGADRGFDGELSGELSERLKGADILISIMNLHKINKINEVLLYFFQSLLREGGMFVGTFLSANNMYDFRRMIGNAESEILGKSVPRFTPGFSMETAGSLLRKAGFEDIVIECSNFSLPFESALQVFYFLKESHEGNVLKARYGRAMDRELFDYIKGQKYLKGHQEGVSVKFEFLIFCCKKSGERK